MHESEAIMLDKIHYDALMKHMDEMARVIRKFRKATSNTTYPADHLIWDAWYKSAKVLNKHKEIKERI